MIQGQESESASGTSVLEIAHPEDGPATGVEGSLSGYVRDLILRKVAANWGPSLRLPPIREMADELGVSVGTVQQAVHGLAEDGILQSRRRAGTVVRPDCDLERVQSIISSGTPSPSNGRAALLAGKLVHVVRPESGDALFVGIARTLTEQLIAHGCRASLIDTPEFVRSVHNPSGRVEPDAVAVIQPAIRHVAAALKPEQPLLTVSSDHYRLDLPGRYDILSVDDEQGSYLAGKRLRDAGCKSACFVGCHVGDEISDIWDEVSERRLAGFERGWGEPIPAPHRFIVHSYDLEPGSEAAARYAALSDKPEAVYAASDDLAIGFVLGACSHGLIAARDYSIIGFDRQMRARQMLDRALTTVQIPRTEMGVRGAELLASRLRSPDQPVRRVYLGCSLFEGETVRKTVEG